MARTNPAHEHTHRLARFYTAHHRSGDLVVNRCYDIAGTIGDYHTNCPLDHLLLDWKGVEYGAVRKALEVGATDEEIARHLDTHGTPKTPEEIRAWSDGVDEATMHGDPEKGSWFDGECEKLGLDGAKTTTFEWLEADDRASYVRTGR